MYGYTLIQNANMELQGNDKAKAIMQQAYSLSPQLWINPWRNKLLNTPIVGLRKRYGDNPQVDDLKQQSS
jgi:hypothetical protein